MTPQAASHSPRVVVRLEASAGALRPGEVRLLQPLEVAAVTVDAVELPRVDGDVAELAIESIFDLHRSLADRNASKAWWYLPVAEWQPNMSELPAALELAARLETLGRKARGRFVLTVSPQVTATYLKERFSAHAAVAIISDRKSQLHWALRRAKAAILRLLNALVWLIENVRHVRSVRRIRRAPPIPGHVHTLFVSRIEAGFLPPSDGVWRDAYLGPLPAEGLKRTGSVALMLRNGGDPAEQVKAADDFKGFPVAFIFEFLSLGDVWHCLRRAWRFRLHSGATRDPLARAALIESYGHVRALADWFVVERAMRNLLRTVAPRQIVCMQENSNWEFAVETAANETSPKPRTVGFFHCPVMPSAQRYRTRADVLQRRPNFDLTITLGSAMRSALLRLGDWAPILSSRQYAFRNPNIEKCLSLPVRAPSAHLRLLVVLGGAFDNGRFLDWVKSATSAVESLTIVIKPHPSFDHRPVLAAAGIDLSDRRFVLSPHSAMDLALGEADVLLYKGTTACFAALAAGVPVIHVGDGGIASDDALFDAGGLSISVSDPDDFASALSQLRAQTLPARQAWAKDAREYVRQYYDLSVDSCEKALAQLFSTSSPVLSGAGEVEFRNG